MRAWGQVEGRRVDAPSDDEIDTTATVQRSRYGGSDWWADCGEREALDRHTARGQRACQICLEGERRREQERIERVTGEPMPEKVIMRQLAALKPATPSQQRRYEALRAPCGTYPARRRHRQRGEICGRCDVKEGDFE